MVGPGGLGCHCYFRASMVFEMKGKRPQVACRDHDSDVFFPFFCEVFIPTKSHNLRHNVRVSKGNAVLLTPGFWWAVVTWRSTTGGRGGWEISVLLSRPTISEVSQKKLIWRFNRNIFHSRIFLPQKDHSRIQHIEPKRISIFGTRIRSNQCNPLWKGVSYCKHGNFLCFLGLRNVESFLWFLR